MATKKKATRTTEKERFAGYPFAEAYEIQYEPELDENQKPKFKTKGGKKIPVPDKNKPKLDKKGDQVLKKKAKNNGQLPWGFVVKDTGKRKNWVEKGKTVAYAACRRRRNGGFERESVWIREDSLQDDPCLEVVFVDIGQGDGCFLVAPGLPGAKGSKGPPPRRRMVIDAGEANNMRHYLNWRHGSSKSTEFEAAIISHPDSDHYKGFESLFERKNFFFKTVYTNGLMESVVPKKKKTAKKKAKDKSTGPKPSDLGPKQNLKCDDGVTRPMVTKLVTSKRELKDFLADRKNWMKASTGKGKQFPTMLKKAMVGTKEGSAKGKTMGDFKMLSIEDEYMLGYEKDKELSIQVLGPVTDKVNNKSMLRWLEGNTGKTKNGHSVVLRLQYKNVSMMLGGDLNIPSEELLLTHHTGMQLPEELEEADVFIASARRVFQVDVAKSCHHGSSDFTHWFLRALNPIATVISSGDDEPHSHPRSDTLGAIGSLSRSHPRPLIFSTELARSSKDSNQKPWELQTEIMKEVEKILAAKTEKSRDNLKEKLKEKLKKDIPRSVAVYGAITVVTDGEKVMIYQKLERKGSHGSYDIYLLEPSGKDKNGPLIYRSKHH